MDGKKSAYNYKILLLKFENKNELFKENRGYFILLNDTFDTNFINKNNHLQMNVKMNKLILKN